jgi:hypothetical protein
MPELWSASLNERSPRYADWRRILGSDDVPLESPHEGMAQLGGELDTVYALDLKKLTPEQFSRLVDWIALQFQERPDHVRKDLTKEGFPIRAADVHVAFSLRAFL